MSSERRPVEIFSFSFLDVIACGVGVILFITILSITQTVAKRDQELNDQLLEEQLTASTLEIMKTEFPVNQAKIKEKAELTEKLARLEPQAVAMRSKAELAAAYGIIKKDYEALKKDLDDVQTAAQELKGRAPIARDSGKEPVVAIAFQGKGVVRVVDRNRNMYETNDYTVDDLLDMTVLSSFGAGQQLSETMKPGGELNRLLARINKRTEYVECYVESDAFEDFVGFRNIAQENGLDVGFLFADDTSKLFYSRSGTSSKVQ